MRGGRLTGGLEEFATETQSENVSVHYLKGGGRPA